MSKKLILGPMENISSESVIYTVNLTLRTKIELDKKVMVQASSSWAVSSIIGLSYSEGIGTVYYVFLSELDAALVRLSYDGRLYTSHMWPRLLSFRQTIINEEEINVPN